MAYFNDGEWYCVREGEAVRIGQTGQGATIEMPLDRFDALALMRAGQLAESLDDDLFEAKMLAACEHGTLGAEALRRWLGLPSILQDDDEAPETNPSRKRRRRRGKEPTQLPPRG